MQSSCTPSSPGFESESTSGESSPRFFSKFHHSRQSSTSTSASFTKRNSYRQSFSFIPDFATLIRSHRNSNRASKAFQTPDITDSAFFSGYADQPQPNTTAVTEEKAMSSSTHHEERPSRKLKSENRLYNFLTRSRSRSRSKNEPTAQDSTMPDVPPKPRSSRRPHNDLKAEPPGSKPPSRLQSRPLSSTTTATNTTITPGTPKPKKQQEQRRPSTATSALPPKAALVEPPPRPTTPRPSGARQRLHDFFSIPLGRKSSRSRSRSRPSSPRTSLDVPPLPTSGIDDDPTPRPRKTYVPQMPRPRSPSPTPEPKVLRVTNATTTSSSTGSTNASIKISKFFSKGNTPEPTLPKQPIPINGPPTLPPIPSSSFVSGPIKRVSSLHRRSLKDAVEPPTQSRLGPPTITHTPPTPLRNPSGSSSKGSSGSGSGSSSQHPLSAPRLGYHAVKGSLDSGYRYRGATMGVVNEEGNTFLPSSTDHYKGKARETPSSSAAGHDLPVLTGIPTPRPGTKMSSATRATKHGSFDFERPGWGTTAMQRSGSNGTTGTGNSTWSKNSETVHREKERESTYGPGLAGVGTLQREMSMKRAQEREELVKSKEKRKHGHGDKERDREKTKERPSTSQRTTPGSTPSGSEHVQGSTSTSGTGKTSSMSKATGRRALLHSGIAVDRKTASGSGLTRLIGLTPAQHGPFSFEPPVPSPTRSTGTASTGTAHEVVLSSSWTGKAEKERERLRDEKERLASRKIGNGSTKRSGDRAPVPVPTVPAYNMNAGYRSGTKGRSLDLGLGLSWAPSKVPQEALLPASGFFSRSLSGSSGGHHNMSRTASGSTTDGRSRNDGMTRTASQNGNPRTGGNSTRDVERSKSGKEVAELFKNALIPGDYKLFRSYVHQFDAHEIPFDGPMGIVSLVENLLVSAPHLGDDGKRRLLDKFVKIILQQA